MQVSEQTIAGVVKDVLQTMAFALVMPRDGEPTDDGPAVCATVRFAGPFSGSVSLTVPNAIVPELVTNMLGSDETSEPSQQQQYDAIGELANVMCGNLVQILAGPEPVFRLDAPRVMASSGASEMEAPNSPMTSGRVPLETGWVELSLVLEGDSR